MKIAVLGKCIVGSFGLALQQMCERDEVHAFQVSAVARADRIAEIAAFVDGCDVVFTQLIGGRFGPLATAALQARHPRVRRFPEIVFTGFHPDCTYLSLAGRQYPSPIASYHSEIAVAAFSLGMGVEEALAFYNAETYRALGHFEEFAKARIFLGKTMLADGLDIGRFWDVWMSHAPFMHTVNHPKWAVVAELARELAVEQGLVPRGTPLPATALDFLIANPVWPVYPEIAEACGIRGGRLFKADGLPDLGTGGRVFLTLEEFLQGSFALYQNIPFEAFQTPRLAQVRAALQRLPFLAD